LAHIKQNSAKSASAPVELIMSVAGTGVPKEIKKVPALTPPSIVEAITTPVSPAAPFNVLAVLQRLLKVIMTPLEVEGTVIVLSPFANINLVILTGALALLVTREFIVSTPKRGSVIVPIIYV